MRDLEKSNEVKWLCGGDEVFDPYTFDGTMSAEDYERIHELMAQDAESEGMER